MVLNATIHLSTGAAFIEEVWGDSKCCPPQQPLLCPMESAHSLSVHVTAFLLLCQLNPLGVWGTWSRWPGWEKEWNGWPGWKKARKEGRREEIREGGREQGERERKGDRQKEREFLGKKHKSLPQYFLLRCQHRSCVYNRSSWQRNQDCVGGRV